MHVLIVGGSGMLGQFLIQALAPTHTVSYTYHTRPLPEGSCRGAHGVQADLVEGSGLHEALTAAGPVDAVINCAAISLPGQCEKDPAAASAVNVPRALVGALRRASVAAAVGGGGSPPLLVHLSTDQVYDGSRPWWSEEDEPHPVNVYGRSKVEAERFVAAEWPHHVILRSSIICAPEPPLLPLGRVPFLQFLDAKLQAGESLSCFHDEYRNPIWVHDICAVVVRLLEWQAAGRKPPHSLYNMGGPDRLSRVDMARAVAARQGYSQDLIKSVSTASVDRGFASPPDISMKLDRLLSDLPELTLTPLTKVLEELLSR